VHRLDPFPRPVSQEQAGAALLSIRDAPNHDTLPQRRMRATLCHASRGMKAGGRSKAAREPFYACTRGLARAMRQAGEAIQ
jgi:hypothetical protein